MSKTKSQGATFEVFQVDSKFQWFVKDKDGNIVDAWNDSLKYDDKLERVVGAKSFNTEDEAVEYFAAEHPHAVNFHTYSKG